MDVVPYRRHLCTLLEVFWVVERVIADVLRSPTTQEGVLYSWAVCNVEVNELFVNTLLLKKIQRET